MRAPRLEPFMLSGRQLRPPSQVKTQSFDFEAFIQQVSALSDPRRPDCFVSGLEAALAPWDPESSTEILKYTIPYCVFYISRIIPDEGSY
jgi:hypothetical protein